MALTKAQIRSRALSLVDMPAASFASNTQVDEFIEAGWMKAHGFAVALGEDVSSAKVEFTTSANTDEYAIASGAAINAGDFWKLRSLELKGTTLRDNVVIEPFTWTERDAWLEYPPSGKTYVLRYIPTVALPGDSTAFPWDGYEDLAIFEAAIRLRIKEEGETNDLLAMQVKRENELRAEYSQRDMDRPFRAVRTRTMRSSRWGLPRYRSDGADVHYCLMGNSIFLRRPTRSV